MSMSIFETEVALMYLSAKTLESAKIDLAHERAKRETAITSMRDSERREEERDLLDEIMSLQRSIDSALASRQAEAARQLRNQRR